MHRQRLETAPILLRRKSPFVALPRPTVRAMQGPLLRAFQAWARRRPWTACDPRRTLSIFSTKALDGTLDQLLEVRSTAH
jgi:hypothetical protein